MRKLILLLTLIWCACNGPKSYKIQVDKRPKLQVKFIQMLERTTSDILMNGNPVSADRKLDSLKKFAVDSLKDVKDWVFVVDTISEFNVYSDALRKAVFLGQETYNLVVKSKINVFREEDVAGDVTNNIIYVVTVPKRPKTKHFKNLLNSISDVKQGDTLLISGAITKLNNRMEVDFHEYFENPALQALDIFPTSIRKKKSR